MKIDVTKIEGYETMSAEEKLKALEELEIDTKEFTKGYVKKEVFDKTASDLAALKKKDRENLSETERLKAEQEEQLKEMQEELNKLKQEKQLGEFKANFLSLGYDEKLAIDTATAFMSGDYAKVFANQKAFQESIEKRVKAEILKGTPSPNGSGSVNNQKTKDDLRKMSAEERYKFSVEHPDEYKAIYTK